MVKIIKYWRLLVVLPIVFYQKTLSFDHGPLKILFPHGYCRFYPSCSEYTKQSIIKYGAICGSAKGAYRVLRCNPWNKGGVDKP